MALILFQQSKGAKRTLTFDFTDALASGEVITSQSASVFAYDTLGSPSSVGQITDLARDSANTKLSLAYSNSAGGIYVIEAAAVTANQIIRQKVLVEVV